MARLIHLTVAALAAAGAAQGQSWQANSFDTGALIHGGAIAEGTLALSCTAPSPEGRPLIETGDHEALRTDTPYDLAVSFSVDFLSAFDRVSHDLPSPSLVIDGTRYALPAMSYSDFYGSWTGLTRFDGPGILELFDATSLTVDSGDGTMQTVATEGLAAAMTAGLSPCLQRWLALGHPLPPRLAAHISRNTDGGSVAAEPPEVADTPRQGIWTDPDLVPVRAGQLRDAATITFQPPLLPAAPGQAMYARALQTAEAACEGAVELFPGAVWPADIDYDGLEDIVFNWGFVGCESTGFSQGITDGCDTQGQCRVTLFSSAAVAGGAGDTSLNAYHAEPEGEGLGLGRVHLSTAEPFCGPAAGTYGCTGWLELASSGWEMRGAVALTQNPRPSYGDQNPSTGDTPLQAFPVPQTPPDTVVSYLFETCQGPFTGDTGDIGSADFDGDGLGDYVLDWNDLTCQGSVGPRPNCGAANCLIDVFLSSRNYTNPEGLLAIGFTMTTLPDGRPGIVTGGTASVCAYENCTAPWVFDGQGFQR